MVFRRRSTAERARAGTLAGIARVDSRTKRLLDRLQPGEIAVISHDDLDRVAAEGLVERRVKAVVNAVASSTGRYPNLGPLVITGAGVPLVDAAGPEVMSKVREGDLIRIEDGKVFVGNSVIAKGNLVTLEQAQEQLDKSQREIAEALERFAENTIQYMLQEKDFLLEATRLPEISTELSGKHVLVVARGYGYKEDLRSLQAAYIRDFHPVLIGVDGGADALSDLGLRPDLIIGDMDSVTTQALTSGAELVLHGYPDGRAPGRERLDALGIPFRVFESPGTSEDIALLLAYEKGAELIVAVGGRASMIEFMDKGRKGMASTFLVRLRVGPKLVDAKGVSELHHSGPSGWQLFGLVAAALVAMLIVVGISEPMQLLLESIGARVRALIFLLRHAID